MKTLQNRNMLLQQKMPEVVVSTVLRLFII
jgi:hypothetical protein